MNNGLVTGDRAWSPELTEVKSVYQYAKFEHYDAAAKSVVIKNSYDFNEVYEQYMSEYDLQG